MSSEHERLVDATTRSHDLDHAVIEAESSVRKHPDDIAARGRLEMAIRIRDDGGEALRDATGEYERSTTKSGDDST